MLILLAAVLRYQYIRVRVPLRQLRELVDRWPETDPDSLREQAGAIRGLPRETARKLLERMEQMEEKLVQLREKDAASADERGGQSELEALRRNVLPRLPALSLPAKAPLELAGTVTPGNAPGILYDCFFSEPDTLCVLLGQATGEGPTAAVRAALAQTALRSFLMSGLKPEEVMNAANRWLTAQENRFSVDALVGLLSLSEGSFLFSAAGNQRVLLRREHGHYERLDVHAGPALGTMETALWEAETLVLRRGDRLFLHTEGLENGRDREGASFSEQGLRAALNLSRDKTKTAEEALRFVANEAAAHCEQESESPPYAALLLEYSGVSPEASFCDLPAQPESAGELLEFLKRQFGPLGIPRRSYAGLMVLADELFVLCCRCSRKDSEIRTACAIGQESGLVELRMSAALDGADPLAENGNLAADTAAAFIRSQAREVRLERGELRDTVVLLWQLQEASHEP